MIKAKRTRSSVGIYVILAIIVTLWLIPFVFILLQSFEVAHTYQSGKILPKTWGLDNYFYLFDIKKCNFLRWYANTFIIALFTCIFQTAFIILTSYGLSRLRFKGRRLYMNTILILGMFPGFLTMLILYYVLKTLSMTEDGAVVGLILVYVASSGMGYYVSKGFFDTIPKSLDEAARMDGATRFQVMYKIILPMAKPIIVYTVLTAFMAPWGEYLFASYIAFGSEEGRNVAVGLNGWLQKDTIAGHYTHFCAGGVCVAIPVALVFMLLQKYYVEGVTGGAVKG